MLCGMITGTLRRAACDCQSSTVERCHNYDKAGFHITPPTPSGCTELPAPCTYLKVWMVRNFSDER